MAQVKKNFSFLNNSKRYTNTAVLLHWLIGIGIIFMLALGIFMTDIPKEAPKQTSFDLFNLGIYTWEVAKEESPRSFYFNFHKSLGVTIFVLVLFRIFWRFSHKPPALLNTMKPWEKRLATAAHHGLYLLMFLIPLTGIIMSIGSNTVSNGLVSKSSQGLIMKLCVNYSMNSTKSLVNCFLSF